VTRYGGVAMSAGGEAAPGSGNGIDDVSWTDTNLIKQKIKKIHTIDSTASN
jgi:hypothetical protein